MKDIILQTKGLTKKYGSFTALDRVDMTVRKGDIYGLIGRNGAGKTTLMKTVTGLTEKTAGEYEMFSAKGSNIFKEKGRIGCLIENPAFFGNMTAYNNLKYYAIQKGITDMKKIDSALETVRLTEVRDKKFKTFSLGMKQRLGIAFALMDDPDFVILDEPINGLDPIGISELRETFSRMCSERGVTMMISSHILSELYMVANRFLFIDKGRALKEMTRDELDVECMRCTVIRTDSTKKAASVIEGSFGVKDYKVIDSSEIRIYDNRITASELNKELVRHDIGVSALFESGITLEEYFKSLVGGNE